MSDNINEKLVILTNLCNNLRLETLSAEEFLQLDELNKEILANKSLSKIFDNYITLINNIPILFLLCLITLKTHRNIKLNIFPSIDQLVTMIYTILEKIYLKGDNFFFIPSINVFLNIIFKLPDLIADSCNSLSKKEYFRSLFIMLLQHKYFVKLNVIEKVSMLKLNKLLISALTLDDLAIIEYYEDSIYYEDFLEALFNTSVSEENMEIVSAIYRNIKVNVITFDYIAVGKDVYSYIKRNRTFFYLILESKNKELKEFFMKSVIKNLNDNFDGLDIISFYIICLSIYIYSQQNDVFKYFLQEILQIQGLILAKLVTKEMKRIYLLLSQYLRAFISKQFDGDELDAPEETIPEDELKLLDFAIVYGKLRSNIFYIYELEEAIINKFNLIKPTEAIKPEKKTKYKSIKFQKKYGVYDKDIKIPMLEVDKQEDIKLKLKSNGKFSFLKLNLEQEDDVSDLNPLSKPIHIKDCIQGISSEYPDRQKMSLEALPDIIISNPFDLEYHINPLSETLLKATNTFELNSFDELVETILVKLVIHSAVTMTQILCKRFFLEECSMTQKYQILTAFEKAAEELSEYCSNSKKTYQNKLHAYFEFIMFPLLHYLHSKDIARMIQIKEFDFLLGKFVMVISKLIKFSENHPLIYKAIFESFDLFKAISILPGTSQLIQEALVYYTSVLSRFLSQGTFLEVYPEFVPSFRYILEYLNSQIDIGNEKLRQNVINTINIYITNIDKLKDSLNINKNLLI
jgi:hypothetical protein